MSTQEESRKWFKRYYGQLVGLTLVKAGIGEVEEFDDEGFPFFILKAQDGTKVKAGDGDPIFQGDVIETTGDGAIGLTFADDTTFSLAEGGQMTIDEMVYDPTSQTGKATFDISQGVFTFVSGHISKTAVDAMMTDATTEAILAADAFPVAGGAVNSRIIVPADDFGLVGLPSTDFGGYMRVDAVGTDCEYWLELDGTITQDLTVAPCIP